MFRGVAHFFFAVLQAARENQLRSFRAGEHDQAFDRLDSLSTFAASELLLQLLLGRNVDDGHIIAQHKSSDRQNAWYFENETDPSQQKTQATTS
jgi:hypothetical protein